VKLRQLGFGVIVALSLPAWAGERQGAISGYVRDASAFPDGRRGGDRRFGRAHPDRVLPMAPDSSWPPTCSWTVFCQSSLLLSFPLYAKKLGCIRTKVHLNIS